MAAGLSAKQQYRREYSALQRIGGDLQRAGVTCEYAKRELNGGPGADTFQIWYRRINASNGECGLLPCLAIFPRGLDGKREYFEFMDFGRGIDRVKALFGQKEGKRS